MPFAPLLPGAVHPLVFPRSRLRSFRFHVLDGVAFLSPTRMTKNYLRLPPVHASPGSLRSFTLPPLRFAPSNLCTRKSST